MNLDRGFFGQAWGLQFRHFLVVKRGQIGGSGKFLILAKLPPLTTVTSSDVTIGTAIRIKLMQNCSLQSLKTLVLLFVIRHVLL